MAPEHQESLFCIYNIFFVAVMFSVCIIKKSTCQLWMAHGDITSLPVSSIGMRQWVGLV